MHRGSVRASVRFLAVSAARDDTKTRRSAPGSRLTNDATLALVDEFDDLINLHARRQFVPDRFDRLASVVLGAINQPKRLLDPLDVFGRKAAPLQPNEIDSTNFGWVSIRDHEGWNVLDDF
jgi:hypothetical protein